MSTRSPIKRTTSPQTRTPSRCWPSLALKSRTSSASAGTVKSTPGWSRRSATAPTAPSGSRPSPTSPWWSCSTPAFYLMWICKTLALWRSSSVTASGRPSSTTRTPSRTSTACRLSTPAPPPTGACTSPRRRAAVTTTSSTSWIRSSSPPCRNTAFWSRPRWTSRTGRYTSRWAGPGEASSPSRRTFPTSSRKASPSNRSAPM